MIYVLNEKLLFNQFATSLYDPHLATASSYEPAVAILQNVNKNITKVNILVFIVSPKIPSC